MDSLNINNPDEQYKKRIEAYKVKIEKLSKKINAISIGRGVFFFWWHSSFYIPLY